MAGDDVVRKIAERATALRKMLEGIEADIARSAAAHREQAERLGRDMDAIQAEIAQRARQVTSARSDANRPDHPPPPASREPGRRAGSARARSA